MAYELTGSMRMPPFPSVEPSPPPEPGPENWPCDVTVYVRSAGGRHSVEALAADALRGHAAEPVARRAFMDGTGLGEVFAADPAELETAADIFRRAGAIHVTQLNGRALRLRGSWAELHNVFGVDYRRFSTPDGAVVGRMGPIEVADDRLHELVTGIFGLDNRRAVSPYVIKSHVIKSHVIKSHVIKSHEGDPRQVSLGDWQQELDRDDRAWFTPEEVAGYYDFPDERGRDCHVGVLAFSGRMDGVDRLVRGGYDADALAGFFTTELGLKSPPRIRSSRIRGQGNWPGDGTSPVDFTDEVMLDLTVAGALAPEARFTVFFSEPTEQGWVDALHHIVELPDEELPHVLLICYGSPENEADGSSWTQAAIDDSNRAFAAAALRGVTVVCSCGDNGAAGAPLSTRVHADFPASSPWVLGCGGTSLRRNPPKGQPAEIVWNDGRGASGGGISAVNGRPTWQQAVRMPDPIDRWRLGKFEGRGVPDIAALADPATGMPVVDGMNDTVVVGGTSVSAPIWAALLARCQEKLGGRLGFLSPAVWRWQGSVATDVPVGDNGAYVAAQGWDPCTGWGVPRGNDLLRALLQPSVPTPRAQEEESAPAQG